MKPNDAHPNRKSRMNSSKLPPSGPKSPPWMGARFDQNPKMSQITISTQNNSPILMLGFREEWWIARVKRISQRIADGEAAEVRLLVHVTSRDPGTAVLAPLRGP